MTYEQALAYFERRKNILCLDDWIREYEDKAIEALEKQIPQKPIIREWSPAKCPCCRAELSESLGDGYYKHWTSKKVCDCGQKLDWD